jgi:hypothetical protein
MEARLDGSTRRAGSLGDVVDRQVAPEPEDDDDPLVGIQHRERPGERVARRDGLNSVGPDEPDHLPKSFRRQLDDRTPPPRSEPVAAGIDDDPAEPRLEAIPVAQARPAAPRGDRGIVNRVLGLHRVAEDDGRQPVGAVEMALDHGAELVDRVGHEAVADSRRQHRRRSLTLQVSSLHT